MKNSHSPLLKSHRNLPPPDFDNVALVLQGGGALGSYQAGVYQAMQEAGLEPDWIAGISIGAINAALIAGSKASERLQRLSRFWQEVSSEPGGLLARQYLPKDLIAGQDIRSWLNALSASHSLFFGVRSMFQPRFMPAWLWPNGTSGALSFYDTRPLSQALERHVDFDLINTGRTRLSLGAVNIRSGNFTYFDTSTHVIGPQHIVASAALPPNFPPVEIDGEFYWDGGVVSNTPLEWVAEQDMKTDTLIFQVDVWNTRGEYPTNLVEAITRQKEIQYASRTRYSTDSIRKLQRLRNAVADALDDLSANCLNLPSIGRLKAEAERKVFQIVHLIYHAPRHQGTTKDFEFSRLNIEEHWRTGYLDAVRTLRHPEAVSRPDPKIAGGVATFDVSVNGRI